MVSFQAEPLEPCATDEEVGRVLEFWASVSRALTGGVPLPSPGKDTLSRVARHQAWQAATACEHSSIVFASGEMRCGDCDRPMQWLSDVQIANMKRSVSQKPER